jgi:hypothetical protein
VRLPYAVVVPYSKEQVVALAWPSTAAETDTLVLVTPLTDELAAVGAGAVPSDA